MLVFLLNSLAMGGSERKVARIAANLGAAGIRLGCAYMRHPDTLRGDLPAGIPCWHLDRRSRLSMSTLLRIRDIGRRYDGVTLVAVNQFPALYAAVARRLWPRHIGRTLCLMNTFEAGRRRDAFLEPLYRWALGEMDEVAYGSEGQRRRWVSQGHHAWPRSRVIYNGVDKDRFSVASQANAGRSLRLDLGIPASRFVFGSVGRLAPEKNYAVLVRCLAVLVGKGVDAALLVVGNGPTRSALESEALRLGVGERVLLPGAMNDVRPALAAMDAFVMPSLSETFSNATLEAMAMSLPVILSDVGGAAEMVTHGEDGLLVSPERLLPELCAQLERLAADTDLRARLGAGCRNRILAQFTDERMLASYRQLLGCRAGAEVT